MGDLARAASIMKNRDAGDGDAGDDDKLEDGGTDSKTKPVQDNDTYYFDSYSSWSIHATMLQDTARTEAYRDSMMKNADFFRNKVVLDVGCGTGILSLFAAKAGARKVIGIDMSAMALHAQQIVRENGYGDRITIVRGKVEDLKSLPDVVGSEVDVIVSEWMGYALLYECMLESVIQARDKWLRKDGKGVVLPNRATIFIEGLSDEESWSNRVSYWSDVYGFTMTSVAPMAVSDPDVIVVDSATSVSDRVVLQTFDANTVTAADLDFEADFTLSCK